MISGTSKAPMTNAATTVDPTISGPRSAGHSTQRRRWNRLTPRTAAASSRSTSP